MSVIFAESVAITKSGLAKGFNGDNMNLNGKVLTVQEADNGFKAAGRIRPPYYAVLASGNQKGFAEGATSAFNDYIKEINNNKDNAAEIIGRYFDDMQTVADNCGIENAKLSVGVVCVYEDCVIAAKSGNCHILRYSAGELFEIALPDDDASRGFQFTETVSDGEMFALIGEDCSEDINYYGIINEFNTESDLKTKVKAFYKLLSENAKEKDCSVILIRIESDDVKEVVAAPADNVVIAEDAYDESAETEVLESTEEDEIVHVVNKSGVDERAALKKKILDAIPIAVLVVIFGITGALFVATRISKPAVAPETTTAETTTEIIAEEISSVVEEKTTISNEMVDVGDPEQGGNAINPETTTQAPETTTQAPETTTQAPETTTQAPETTTQAPETTTQAPETTTQAPETTTQAPETTTQAPETTTQAPETTTQAPETTTQAPDTTTQAPETTTQAPETTTQAPETTTESETTLSEPVTPETTTAVVEDEVIDIPVDEPADEPADDTVDEPADEPVDIPVEEPVDELVDEPADESDDEPVDDIIDNIEEEPVG